jgi:sortase A
MKKKTTLVLIALLLLGIGLLLYPTVSNYVNSCTQSRAMVDYEEKAVRLSEEDIDAVMASAQRYNEALHGLRQPLMEYRQLEEGSPSEGYEAQLNVAGNGVMGSISIEKIRVRLPIYHGTSNEILNVAVGHLQGSSLPIGGEGSHAVLAAHRGLPSAKLFSDLDKLEVGDIFTITSMNRTVTYEVDLISITEPDDAKMLRIEDGKDYCTLFTCTPYGINTHRLLVRGKRTENRETVGTFLVPSDACVIDPFIVAPALASLLLLFFTVFLLIRYRNNSGGKKG